MTSLAEPGPQALRDISENLKAGLATLQTAVQKAI